MTFPAANMRLGYISMCLLAIRSNLNAPLKPGSHWTVHNSMQLQKLAGIGLQNARHRTSAAQVGRPGLIRGIKETALFRVTAPEVISIKIFAFFPGRSFHKIKKKTDNLGRCRGELSVLGIVQKLNTKHALHIRPCACPRG